ncbi:MAG: DUF5060 domain-containing protein [Bacteroidota bacterium]
MSILPRVLLTSLLFCLFGSGRLLAQSDVHQYESFHLDFKGPSTAETASENPFLDYRLQVRFQQGEKTWSVPGFFAADGKAAESSASSGGIWRVYFTPPEAGTWQYEVSFRKGPNLATSDDLYAGQAIKPHDGKKGTFQVLPKVSTATAFLASGRLRYNGHRYLETQNGEVFLKFGANSPENFFACKDIDGTYAYDPDKQFLKSWSPHVQDWEKGDPSWQGGKGKGIIGALNYLADKGMNVVYALTLNIEGDARDVWPFLSHERKDFLRYDVSKLAQWEIIFTHAEKLGIVMHLITQEKENELILDDGHTQRERKLYYRELIARFAHHNNIIWNMGEENGQVSFWWAGMNDQQRYAMIRYIKDHDPYHNPVVIHTMSEVSDRDPILTPLLGFDRLDGLSLQVSHVHNIHRDIKDWLQKSAKANRPWIIMMDEIGPWHTGTRTDADDPGHYTLRAEVLWGTMMAGGAGVEWYFGFRKPPNDLNAEDWRSRNNIWEQSAIAAEFLTPLPLREMESADHLLGQNSDNYCLAQAGKVYAIYLKQGGTTYLDLRGQQGEYSISWFDPRKGGNMQKGSKLSINGGGMQLIGDPPSDASKDWAVLILRKS